MREYALVGFVSFVEQFVERGTVDFASVLAGAISVAEFGGAFWAKPAAA